MSFAPQAAQELWQSRGWEGSRWLLISSFGEEAGSGLGIASGEKALALLREKGLTPRWEARQAFLNKQPENGDAWSEEVLSAALLAKARMQVLLANGKATQVKIQTVGVEMPGMAISELDPAALASKGDQIFGELAEALGRARKVEGWWRGGSGILPMLPTLGVTASPRMRDIGGTLAAELENILANNCSDGDMEIQWVTHLRIADKPLRQLPERVPVPGQDEPPSVLLGACVSDFTARKDWEGALALLDGLPAKDTGGPWTPEAWRSWCQSQATIAAYRVLPLWEQGRGECQTPKLLTLANVKTFDPPCS
jgi:hypothetical protein